MWGFGVLGSRVGVLGCRVSEFWGVAFFGILGSGFWGLGLGGIFGSRISEFLGCRVLECWCLGFWGRVSGFGVLGFRVSEVQEFRVCVFRGLEFAF